MRRSRVVTLAVLVLGLAFVGTLCHVGKAEAGVLPGITLAQASDPQDSGVYPDIEAIYVGMDGPDLLLGAQFWRNIQRYDPRSGREVPLLGNERLTITFSSDQDHAFIQVVNESGRLVGHYDSSPDGNLWKGVEVQYQYFKDTRLLVLRIPRTILKGSATLTCRWYASDGTSGVDVAPDQGLADLRADFPKPPYYTDISPDSPYYLATSKMFASGIAMGYEVAPGHREYRPASPIWRAQFAQMIAVALHLPLSEQMTVPFDDLGADNPMSYYPHQYVAAAAAAGITRGVAPRRFDPYSNLSRAQAISMVIRALEEQNHGLQEPPAGYRATVADDDPTHGYDIRKAEYNGILSAERVPGYGPGWDIWAPATRGEVAQLLIPFLAIGD